MAKTLEEIKQTPGIKIKREGLSGLGGSIYPIEYIKGKTKIITKSSEVLNFIFSIGCGFEHLSVSTTVGIPTWEQMCKMKDIFWNKDEVCMQLHPKEEDYVDQMRYCLHIWRPIDQEIPTPPSIMVGFRKGKTEEDLQLLEKYKNQMPRWQ